MKFYLRDINKTIVEKWNEFFGDDPNFDIKCDDIFSVPKVDALVSPSNSFGFLDGGIDYVYTKKFGVQLEFRLREHIEKECYGELPVGQAVIISTGNEDYPSLISAPTMRVPGSVKNTVNAYLAFRAVLILVKNNKNINSILCPGLGTAIGEIKPFACAKQMYEAYKAIWEENPLEPNDCADIWYNNQQLLGWAPTEFKFDGRDVIGGTDAT